METWLLVFASELVVSWRWSRGSKRLLLGRFASVPQDGVIVIDLGAPFEGGATIYTWTGPNRGTSP